MADFKPESSIYLFSDCRVDDNNQPYFTNEGQKMSWYFGHQNISFSNASYQREERRYIRIPAKAEDIRKYDMVGYRNGDGKWVIARITAVEFINPNCTEVTFEVDYMQTYIENTQFRHCWVEREMQENDWNGNTPSFNNWQPESLETGILIRTIVPNIPQMIIDFNKVCVLSALNRDGEPVISPYYHNEPYTYPSVINTIEFGADNVGMNELGQMLTKYVEKGRQDAIAAIYLSSNKNPLEVIDVPLNWKSIDGYEPINAKCWSSEFCKFILSNRQGNESILMPEYYKGQTSVRLNLVSCFADGSGGSLLYPFSYYGSPRGNGVYLPWNIQIAWATSGWYNWLGQNMGSVAQNVTDEAITRGFFGALSGGTFIGGAGAGLISSALSSAGKTIDAYLNPEYRAGSGNGSLFQSATQSVGFNFEISSPSAPAIESIDNFFSMYGYRTNRLKVPNINTRPLWNYVKTAGAVVTGPFSSIAKQAMQQQLDNGVTFWHVPAATIGEYSDLAGNRNS